MTEIEPRKPQIWVDADACPVVIKEILYRAAT
ncbi:MAG TPA: YaiI/YqxD family protein, partial [Methylophaga sp.]|nr:YaiI/YqxD family protein [Methylophaga sp.]